MATFIGISSFPVEILSEEMQLFKSKSIKKMDPDGILGGNNQNQ